MAAKLLNKSEILASIATTTELSRKQVASVLDALADLIKTNVGKKGPGMFVVPSLMKIMVVQKPATPERKGINPFTKEEMIIKAKPATNVVKLVPLKGLKAMVQAISPEATNISAEDLQADLDENTKMVSEGGPTY